jgi:hypothetical protein
MDSLKVEYRDIIEKVLKDYADFLGNDAEVQVELVFDREHDTALAVAKGIATFWWKMAGKMVIGSMELCCTSI